MTRAAQRDARLRTAIASGPERPDPAAGRQAWHAYATQLSRCLAQAFADALRPGFRGIRPLASGSGHESDSAGATGKRRLDVNFSTVLHGLGLGVSIKTINKRDARSGNFRHNLTRVDHEFRAEASECHRRQPYAVLVGCLFLPKDACADHGKRSPSTFGSAVRTCHSRCRRRLPNDEADRFEKMYVALYDPGGDCGFFDAESPPPRRGPPRLETVLPFADVVERIETAYRERNGGAFVFDDGKP